MKGKQISETPELRVKIHVVLLEHPNSSTLTFISVHTILWAVQKNRFQLLHKCILWFECLIWKLNYPKKPSISTPSSSSWRLVLGFMQFQWICVASTWMDEEQIKFRIHNKLPLLCWSANRLKTAYYPHQYQYLHHISRPYFGRVYSINTTEATTFDSMKYSIFHHINK